MVDILRGDDTSQKLHSSEFYSSGKYAIPTENKAIFQSLSVPDTVIAGIMGWLKSDRLFTVIFVPPSPIPMLSTRFSRSLLNYQ